MKIFTELTGESLVELGRCIAKEHKVFLLVKQNYVNCVSFGGEQEPNDKKNASAVNRPELSHWMFSSKEMYRKNAIRRPPTTLLIRVFNR